MRVIQAAVVAADDARVIYGTPRGMVLGDVLVIQRAGRVWWRMVGRDEPGGLIHLVADPAESGRWLAPDGFVVAEWEPYLDWVVLADSPEEPAGRRKTACWVDDDGALRVLGTNEVAALADGETGSWGWVGA